MDTPEPALSARQFYSILRDDPVRLMLWRTLARRIYAVSSEETTRAWGDQQDQIVESNRVLAGSQDDNTAQESL